MTDQTKDAAKRLAEQMSDLHRPLTFPPGEVTMIPPYLTLVQLDFSGVTSFVDEEGTAYAGQEAAHRAWVEYSEGEVEQVREALTHRVPVVSLPPGVKVQFIAVPVLPLADEVAPAMRVEYPEKEACPSSSLSAFYLPPHPDKDAPDWRRVDASTPSEWFIIDRHVHGGVRRLTPETPLYLHADDRLTPEPTGDPPVAVVKDWPSTGIALIRVRLLTVQERQDWPRTETP